MNMNTGYDLMIDRLQDFVYRGQLIVVLLVTIATCMTLAAPVLGKNGNATHPTTTMDSTTTINLEQAIQITLANNSNVKRALLSVKDADEQVLSAWGEVMPKLSASMDYTRNMEIPVNFIPAKVFDPTAPAGKLVPVQFGTDNNWAGGLTVTQTIFRGEALIGISSSAVYKMVQSESYRATMHQVVTQTRLAYYQVLIAEEQLKLQKAAIQRLEQNLKDNRARQRAGLLDEYDVLRVEVQLSNERPQLTEARYNVSKAYRQLKLMLGLPNNVPFRITGNLRTFQINTAAAQDSANRSLKQVDQWVNFQQDTTNHFMDRALGLRADMRMFDARLNLKDRQILAVKSRYFPNISATYNLRWNAAEPGTPNFFGSADERARSQAVMLNFSFPLFQGFQRNVALQRTQIEKRDLQIQKHYQAHQARNDILNAREALMQSIETVDARKKALQQAKRGYNIAVTRLDNGVSSQLDVTDAELQYQQAEVNYAQLVFNYLAAKARYDQAIGIVPFVDNSDNK